MISRSGVRAASIALLTAAIPTLAADIVLTPPAASGVSITNAAGNTTRFRVGEDGNITVPGIAAVPVPSTGLCVEIATGKVGTCAIAGGTVTGVSASAPLASSGGAAPNISLTGTIPVANGGTGATTLPANGVLYGQGTGAVATAVGTAGQLLAGTAGAPAWTASPSIDGNLTLVASTASVGNVMKGAARFIHNSGTESTFVGVEAGSFSASGAGNTGSGYRALSANLLGTYNTAVGSEALRANSIGNVNTAAGYRALFSNLNGGANTAIGDQALMDNTGGSNNTAVGSQALWNATGSSNISIGASAGINILGGNFNIAIGHAGVAADAGTIRIGSVAAQTRAFVAGIRGVTTDLANAIPVVIATDGQLGTLSSSRRVKDDIADMSEASAALMKLRPVTFHYKEHGPASPLQYGLIAEEVAEVYPGLIARSSDGEVETVMYQHLPAMLLNEYQKQKRMIERQAEEIASLKARTDWLVKTLEGLASGGTVRTAALP